MVFCKGGGKCKHFDKESAEEAVSRIYYTTKDGTEHHGPHWSMEQVLEATKGLQFKPCVTDYDKRDRNRTHLKDMRAKLRAICCA